MSFGNFYSPNPNSNSLDLASTFPQIMNVVSQTKNIVNPNSQPTYIEEVQKILLNLPPEQRIVVEQDENYIVQKASIMEEYLLWSIASTELGRAYLLGPGESKSRQLLDIAKELASKAPSLANNEIQELKNALSSQQEAFLKQQEDLQKLLAEQSKKLEQLSEFKAQFEEPQKGDTSNV